MIKKCRICQNDFEITNKYAYSRQFCYNCVPEGLSSSERTTIKRQSAKKEALRLLGGECLNCGEDREFLIDFHHLDSNEKEYSFGKLLGDSKFEEYFKELEKAIPLCSNCHREFHFLEKNENVDIYTFLGIDSLTLHIETEDRAYTRKEKSQKTNTPIPIFEQKEKQLFHIEDYDALIEEIRQTSFTEVGKKYGVSDNAIKKRLKLRGYPYLMSEIKPKVIKEREINWRDEPITIKKDKEVFNFNSGNEAIDFIVKKENHNQRLRVSQGLNRVVKKQRLSYLGYTIVE